MKKRTSNEDSSQEFKLRLPETAESEANNIMCEAVGCLEKATDKIGLNGGEYGTINLSLCKNCVRKFEEDKNSHHITGVSR